MTKIKSMETEHGGLAVSRKVDSKYDCLFEVAYHNGAVSVELLYPERNEEKRGGHDETCNPYAINANISCVRANDGIRFEFDFERNGWSILYPIHLRWAKEGADYSDVDVVYKEVYFVQDGSFDHVDQHGSFEMADGPDGWGKMPKSREEALELLEAELKRNQEKEKRNA
jgi:hypothetical protein